MFVCSQQIDAEWRKFRAEESEVLGVHIRGTDKSLNPKVPAEDYLPYILSWLYKGTVAASVSKSSDTVKAGELEVRRLVFVATDDAASLNALVSALSAVGLGDRLVYRYILR